MKGEEGKGNGGAPARAPAGKRGVFEKAGYRKLILWQNLYQFRHLVYDATRTFPSSEYRRVAQMRDAARSSKQNVQEPQMQINGGRRSVVACLPYRAWRRQAVQTRGADGAAPSKSQHIMTD